MKLNRHDIQILSQAAVGLYMGSPLGSNGGKSLEFHAHARAIVELDQSVAFKRFDVLRHIRYISQLCNVQRVRSNFLQATQNFNLTSPDVLAGRIKCWLFSSHQYFPFFESAPMCDPEKREPIPIGPTDI